MENRTFLLESAENLSTMKDLLYTKTLDSHHYTYSINYSLD